MSTIYSKCPVPFSHLVNGKMRLHISQAYATSETFSKHFYLMANDTIVERVNLALWRLISVSKGGFTYEQ